jgi:hypothetical protein
MLAIFNMVAIVGTLGGYEQDFFGFGRCLLQMLFFAVVSVIFVFLSENAYYKEQAKKRAKRKAHK